MATNNYLQNDKTARLALFYGINNLHSGNGKLIREKIEILGSSQIKTLQLALGVGPVHAITKATYAKFDIPLSNVILHNDGDDPTDEFFPDDVAHPGASWANIRLPEGYSTEGNVEEVVLQVEGRLIADYNSAGSQTGFGYSKSPARLLGDATKLLEGSVAKIDWGAFAEYKAWCAETISVVRDGVTISIPRFELSLFFIPPFSLKAIFDRITQLTCSDWQEVKGKYRFIPAVNRDPDYTFDLSKVTRDFVFKSLKKSERPNGVIVSYRDIDDPFLEDAEPEIVKRDDLIEADDGIENFLPINAGVCNKSQAERVAHYWAKVRCDLLDFALNISGHPSSYKMLPGDIALLSHTTPDWTDKRVKIVKKLEREDRQNNSAGVEKFDAYRFNFQREPANPYSDTDHTPMVTREQSDRPSLLSPPPPIFYLTLSEQVRVLSDGSVDIAVVGVVEFGNYGFRQRGKVYWKKAGGAYEELRDIFSKEDNTAQFRKGELTVGDYYFKVVVYNDLGIKQTGTVYEFLIPCDGKDDAPNPVTGFSLTYKNGYYIGTFTKPNNLDIKQYNILDIGNNYLFSINSTYFTYQSPLPTVILKVEVEDTSGNKSTKVQAGTSIPYCVIDKGGVSTLDKVKLKIAGTPIGATHRKIEWSTHYDMSSPETPIIRELDDQILLTLDEISRTYSPTPQTVYVEVKHSLDGETTWTAASNRLTIQFYNELDFGVPEFDSVGELKTINGSWLIKIPDPVKNGFGSKTELILIDDNGFGILDGDHSASATTLNLQSWFRDLTTTFPESGRFVIQRDSSYFEICKYTSRDANHFYGLTRGLDGTTPLDFENGNGVWLIIYQDDPKGNTFPQLPVSAYAYFHARNGYRENGSDGWSPITFMGRLVGKIEQIADSVPDDSLVPPPATPPALPPDYEDPTNPIYDKYNRQREIDFF